MDSTLSSGIKIVKLFMQIQLRSFVCLLSILWASLSYAQSLTLTPTEQAYIQANPVVTMCIDPDWLPFEAIDNQGKHVGLSADFMQEYSKLIGVEIRLVPTKTWSESIAKAKARTCDILSMLNTSPEREQYLNFTDPYVTGAVVIVSNSDVLYLNGLSSLSGKKLALPKNYIYESLIKRDYPEIEIVYTNTQYEALKLVSTGKAYATIGTQITVLRDLQALATQNVKVAGFTEYKTVLRVGVRKDDPVLLSVFSKAVAALPLQRQNEILQSWYSVKVEQQTNYRFIFQLIGVFALLLFFGFMRYRGIRRFNQALKEKNIELKRLSQTDHLTGVYNRLKTDECIKEEITRCERYARSFVVILFDIDHFKAINDRYGHQVGDQVLCEISRVVQENIRQSDVLGRWGGEEFMVVCPELDNDSAGQLAEKLRELIETYPFSHQVRVTASFGVTEFQSEDRPTDILRRADERLYEAKGLGRNCVSIG